MVIRPLYMQGIEIKWNACNYLEKLNVTKIRKPNINDCSNKILVKEIIDLLIRNKIL